MTQDNKSTPQQAPVQTEASKIWNEIKDKEVLMFALPNQKVSDYCQPISIEPSRCFLVHKAQAVLPALEEVIGKDFVCEAVDKYIVVSRKPANAIR